MCAGWSLDFRQAAQCSPAALFNLCWDSISTLIRVEAYIQVLPEVRLLTWFGEIISEAIFLCALEGRDPGTGLLAFLLGPLRRSRKLFIVGFGLPFVDAKSCSQMASSAESISQDVLSLPGLLWALYTGPQFPSVFQKTVRKGGAEGPDPSECVHLGSIFPDPQRIKARSLDRV